MTFASLGESLTMTARTDAEGGEKGAWDDGWGIGAHQREHEEGTCRAAVDAVVERRGWKRDFALFMRMRRML